MSELSRCSGVSVPTIKFYLREGLLAPGEAVGATRALYDDSHVRRLRLVRALVEVAGMSLERVRDVLQVVDDNDVPVDETIGYAHALLSPTPAVEPSPASRQRVHELLASRGWYLESDSHTEALAAALDNMDAVGQPMQQAALVRYADAAALAAAADLAALGRGRGTSDATTYAVLGTLLVEPALLALRRMAQKSLFEPPRRRPASPASATEGPS